MNRRYVVGWQSYREADDTGEPPHYISQHFIATYWRRFDERKKDKGFIESA